MNHTTMKFTFMMALMLFFLIYSIISENVLYSNVFAALSIFISTFIFHYLLSRRNEKSKTYTSRNEIKRYSINKNNNKEVSI